MGVNLPELLLNDWKFVLKNQFTKEYFINLQNSIDIEFKQETVYPPLEFVFNAFNLTSFADTKVIIIGQDPYHGAGQAHGLCFSVPNHLAIPPSLKNIYKELAIEYNPVFQNFNGNLSSWASQGVFLLNAILTVRANQAGSHSHLGWQNLTEQIIHLLNTEKENLVFMLWGNYAQKLGKQIDRNKHLVLEAHHPSPLSANKGGWFGHNHFIKANQYLVQNGIQPIDWI